MQYTDAMRRGGRLALLLSVMLSGCRFDAGGLAAPDAFDGGEAEVQGELPDTTASEDAAPDTDEASVDAGDAEAPEVAPTDGASDAPLLAWTETGWSRRRRLAVDGAQLTADLTDFVVPVVLSEPDLLSKIALDGRDIRFTAIDGTLLPFEIALWDSAGGKLVAWVKLPKIGPALPNDFFLYYGNAAAKACDDRVKTWSGETAVWHFDETTINGGTTARLVDATGGGHDGAQNGSESAPGVLLGGQRFDGRDAVEVAKPNEIVLGDTDCTFAAWMRTSDSKQQGILIKAKGETHESGDKLFGTGHEGPYLGVDHGWVGFMRANDTVTDGKWHHVAWVQFKDGTGKNESWWLFFDGQEKAVRSLETKPDVGGHSVRIGAKASGSYFDNPWTGDLDEVRYVKAFRSAAWIRALERSQRSPSTFVLGGPEETTK